MRFRIFTFFLFLFAFSNAYGVTCEELIQLVRSKNLDVKSGSVSIDVSRYSLFADKKSYFPKVSFNAQFQEFYPYQTMFSKSWNQNYSYGLTASFDVLNFQKRNKIELDEKLLETSKRELSVTVLNSVYNAVGLLLNLKAKEEIVKIKKKNVEDSKKILKATEERYKKGFVLITDVLKAQADLQKALSDFENAKLDYKETFNDLNEVVDYALKENEKPEVILKEKFPLKSLDYYLHLAFKNRPEIKKAKSEIKVAKAELNLQKSTLSPSLSVSASWNKMDTTFPPDDNNYSLSLTFSYPFFDSGVTKFKVLSESRKVFLKELALKKIENAVKKEVINAYIAVKSKSEVLKSAFSFLSFSRKAYDRTLKEYELGVTDIVNLLQTHSAYVSAQENYINALLSYNLAVLQLLKATGEMPGGTW
ncbi:Outer membrane protein TolC [Desulfurobacterium pacificum]|uniref:Outer membrane protein TolC n=1 Tax=Desulfurobacterium pacificum TaxID=240166 RepID=A0ABY1NBS0_9BACT|nr:TolC family protein [Desulfurobacterium pacificum]SMP05837.1 Outer membrane protein TolC [Desulfurobacterium pacificum]